MEASIGRIVHYTLSATDAEEINRRRVSSKYIADRISLEAWPIGAQAHIGSPVIEGQAFPMIVVACGTDIHGVNGQVFLDANDVLWVNARPEGTGPGTWAWPPRLP